MGKKIVHVEFPEAEGKQPIPGIGWLARCRETEGNSLSLYQGDQNAA